MVKQVVYKNTGFLGFVCITGRQAVRTVVGILGHARVSIYSRPIYVQQAQDKLRALCCICHPHFCINCTKMPQYPEKQGWL